MEEDAPSVPIRVLIVDDSFVARRVLEEGLARHEDIEVMAAVSDPFCAMERMTLEWPDVVVLDVEKQKVAGISFLRQIMSTHPTPVVICSDLAHAGADVTVQALQLGAFAIIPKPKLDITEFLDVAADDLAGIIRVAASSKNQKLMSLPSPSSSQKSSTKLVRGETTDQSVVAIGCASGGTQILESVLSMLPRTAPGILVAHHMPRELVNTFVESLDRSITLSVKVAETGDLIQSGWVFLAPGGKQLLVERDGVIFRCLVGEVSGGSTQSPSADLLFQSVAKEVGSHATGFVLAGMGNDGVSGLKAMRDAGAATYAQDDGGELAVGHQGSIEMGAVMRVVSQEEIPSILKGAP